MIEVEGLTKYYGEQAAIRDLTFRIAAGEVVGFLGLNGAGKTTTLKILANVLLASSGSVRIDGVDVARAPHALKRRIGYLPERPPLYDEMTVGGYLRYVAELHGVPRERARRAVEAVEERTDLADSDRKLLGALSHGFRQRVGVAQALVHDPAVLLLDEPGKGLDPVQIVEMRALLKSLRSSHTVLVSSHILPEIAQTCDRLLVLKDGELVAQGTEHELEQRVGGSRLVVVRVKGPLAGAEAAVRAVSGVQAVTVVSADGGEVELRVEAPASLRPTIARAVVSAGLDLLKLDEGQDRLESLFLRLTRGADA
ncbi:MAG TPA: ABC transporter ATP-binding protein [Myxococcaceae bacterium]|nr:ABC transporter ATP-binding protein [Myxococcaceae bacterium]